jgi:hypothetical protein
VGELLLGACQGAAEAGVVEWLQQVIQRTRLEGAQRILNRRASSSSSTTSARICTDRSATAGINAGVLAAKVSIIGSSLAAEGVGPIAIGQPRLQYTANVNYTIPWWPVASLDFGAVHFGSEPATVDDHLYTPAVTQLNLGGRYAFTIFGANSTLRVQIQNLTGSFWWTNAYTPGLFQWPAPRTLFAYITTDL